MMDGVIGDVIKGLMMGVGLVIIGIIIVYFPKILHFIKTGKWEK